MPTENKTANLGLNSWLGTDKPMREDFVSDNEKIDKAITDHLNDTTLHITEEQITRINKPFEVGIYIGDGQASKTIDLTFQPKLVVVFLRSMPLFEYNSADGYVICNSAIFTSGGAGGSLGGSIIFESIQVLQNTTPSNGRLINLNKQNSAYVYIAFK